ncbi:MAG TPA: hypothetical protein VJN42_04405 [Candidatus Acidoferrum sp.]|nr:hypothetical protein [Candidatus Acidoferrum sp.]
MYFTGINDAKNHPAWRYWRAFAGQNLPPTLLNLWIPITAGELLIASAILLAFSALLLIFNRRQRIALRRSVVTDELMVHLARIGDLLECLPMSPIQSVVAEAPKRGEDPPPQKLAGQSHSIPYSILGR